MARVADDLTPGERVVALLPFAAVLKLPRLPKEPGQRRRKKVHEGLRQSQKRYRPVVFTNRRMFVFDSGRTPHTRALLAELPLEAVALVGVTPAGFGQQVVTLSLRGEGEVPFEVGKKELADVEAIRSLLATP
jgi:hypothetical protein